MKRKRHTPEQIIAKLREAELALAAGKSVADVARQLGISEQTFGRWRNCSASQNPFAFDVA